MQHSDGKRAARDLYYRELLPRWFSEEELRSGSYLALLGPESCEFDRIRELGVPAHHIWSVERRLDVYRRQEEQEWGCALYLGELERFLRSHLRREQAFVSLNLDIEGTYKTHVDPVMTHALLYCWRNPRTAIATYSSVQHREEMIWEGVLSLGLFLWLDADITNEVFWTLCARYTEAGFTEPEHMTLRVFFWIRSVLEHVAHAGVIVGSTRPRHVRSLMLVRQAIHASLTHVRARTLRFRHVEQCIAELAPEGRMRVLARSARLPRLGIELSRFAHLIYRNGRRASQLALIGCYRQAPSHRQGCRAWVRSALSRFIVEDFTHIDRHGARQAYDMLWSDMHRIPNNGARALTGMKRYKEAFTPREIDSPIDEQIAKSMKRIAQMTLS